WILRIRGNDRGATKPVMPAEEKITMRSNDLPTTSLGLRENATRRFPVLRRIPVGNFAQYEPNPRDSECTPLDRAVSKGAQDHQAAACSVSLASRCARVRPRCARVSRPR